MERKVRKRIVYVPREKNYTCIKCGAKGDCGDKPKETFTKKGIAFYWDEKNKKIVCTNCGHWLESKEELEEALELIEIQQYGFWIRFAKEHFVPCEKCQDKLHKLLSEKELCIGNKDTEPSIELWRKWEYVEEPDKETKKRIEDWDEDKD